MIVSGLPEKNGSAHATHVARTALELLRSIGSVSIPHLPPSHTLSLRIGLHSGEHALQRRSLAYN
jgi:hypothetical protein